MFMRRIQGSRGESMTQLAMVITNIGYSSEKLPYQHQQA